MSPIQIKLTFAFSALLLLPLTLLRVDLFIGSHWGIWLYRVLVPLAMVGLAFAFGRLLSKRVVWCLIAGLLVSECLLALCFRCAVAGVPLPTPIVEALSYLYFFHACDAIVYHEQRGRYDDGLFYTLQPGQFEFANMEFSNHYEVNSLGLRDDEASLRNPEMVFLGDSYTMGWGVEQTEAFPELLAKRMGRKALNMGIASYGTAREFLALEKVPLDSCRLLVLQFCPNDVAENHAFISNGCHLKVSPRRLFEDETRHNRLNAHYFPFKYAHGCLAFLVKKCFDHLAPTALSDAPPKGISQQGVADFFAVLGEIRTRYPGPIVVFHLGMGTTQPVVYQQFQTWLEAHPMSGVSLFNAANVLSVSDYYLLDQHLTVSGNQKLAAGLAAFLADVGL